MSKRYTIKHEPSIVRSWFAIEDHHPRRTPPTGFEGYDKTDAQDVADMLNDRIDLLAALRSLILVISDDPNDYPDAASHRQVQDKIAHAKSTIAKAGGE